MSYINWKTYHKPEDLQIAVTQYFKDCADKEITPNPSGLNIHLGVTQRTVDNYRKAEGYEEYHEIMEAAYEYIANEAWQDLKNGKGTFGAYYLTRWRKLSERSEVEHSGGVKVVMPSVKIGNTTLTFNVGEEIDGDSS